MWLNKPEEREKEKNVIWESCFTILADSPSLEAILLPSDRGPCRRLSGCLCIHDACRWRTGDPLHILSWAAPEALYLKEDSNYECKCSVSLWFFTPTNQLLSKVCHTSPAGENNEAVAGKKRDHVYYIGLLRCGSDETMTVTPYTYRRRSTSLWFTSKSSSFGFLWANSVSRKSNTHGVNILIFPSSTQDVFPQGIGAAAGCKYWYCIIHYSCITVSLSLPVPVNSLWSAHLAWLPARPAAGGSGRAGGSRGFHPHHL